MKTLRKKCVRCEADVDPNRIDPTTLRYVCQRCNSVITIYEERDFIGAEKAIKQPAGIHYEYLGDDLHIYLAELPTGEMLRSVMGTAILLIIFIGIFALTGSTTLMGLCFVLGSIGWVINLLFYWRIENRTYEIILNPYRIRFFEKLLGLKRKLKEVDSYEVDRIRIDTKENPGVPGKNKTDFIMQTKQYEQVKPFYHSADRINQLQYLKFLMDNYLNIKERISDISG